MGGTTGLRESRQGQGDEASQGGGNLGKFPGFFFDSPDEAVKAAEGLLCLAVQFLGLFSRQITQSLRKMNEILGFG